MRSLYSQLTGVAFLFVATFISSIGVSEIQSREANNILDLSIIELPDGDDFATLNLRDSWDMSEFTDVSQALNLSGQADYLTNILVQDGVFSASSTNLMDAQFFVLWPGYNTAMLIGKTGHNYPINAQTYHCLYIGMKVNSKMADNRGPDVYQVFWFANELLNGAGGTWGYSKGITLYPEAGKSTPAAQWKLYKLNLADSEIYGGGARWSDRETWQGLRIDPTNQTDIDFEIDWVRLTDCVGGNYEINWQGGNGASILVSPQGTNREILVATNVTSPYLLDVQGLPPGVYTYSVKENNQVLSSGGFEINQSPIAIFARPSSVSGGDYATQSGNPWDFSDASDVRKIHDMAYSFTDGVLNMETTSGEGVDAIIELNTPQYILNSTEYRYLNFRMYVEGPWQNVPEGMNVRWIWRTSGASGGSGFECHLVGHDIPYDIGWQTYSIDLSDSFNGNSEEIAGDCEGLPRHWVETSPVFKLRFDPNENIMGVPLHQQLDWIQLTQVDRVTKGNPFPVQIGLNKSPDGLTSIAFYYTDNLQNPTQHRAVEYLPINSPDPTLEDTRLQPGAQLQENQAKIFLPGIYRNYIEIDFPPIENGVNFAWDTRGVIPGEYYICVVVADQFNTGTYCSEAPAQVIAP